MVRKEGKGLNVAGGKKGRVTRGSSVGTVGLWSHGQAGKAGGGGGGGVKEGGEGRNGAWDGL